MHSSQRTAIQMVVIRMAAAADQMVRLMMVAQANPMADLMIAVTENPAITVRMNPARPIRVIPSVASKREQIVRAIPTTLVMVR